MLRLPLTMSGGMCEFGGDWGVLPDVTRRENVRADQCDLSHAAAEFDRGVLLYFEID